ncbi:MAG: NAD-dependent DNA ligase LigA [Candidatus Absconditabacterales bacterium]
MLNLSEQTKHIQSFIQHHPKISGINPKELSDFYIQLIDCLVDHNHQYYIENKPIISDKEYDELFDYLKKIEEVHPEIITSNSPTQGLIGQVSEGFKQAQHESKLMSLENTYNAKDLEERDERIHKILEKNTISKNTDKDNIVFGTNIILETKDGKYLFQKRDHNTKASPGKITLFGGSTEKNESHEEGIIREIQEELEGKIDKKDLVEIGNFASHVVKDKYIKIFYISGIDETKLTIHEGESMEILSLEEAEKSKEVTDFTKEVIRYFKNSRTISYRVEPKFDGLSVELIYKKGIFTQAITRGDGLVGDDVTENVRTIKNVPKKLKLPLDIHVRGEILMPKSIWKELNKEREDEGEIPFANTRNAAAGSIKLLDPKEVAKRGLVVYIYDVLAGNLKLGDGSQNNVLPVFPREKTGLNIQEVINLCEDPETKKMLEKQDIEFDGLVIKVENQEQREIIGSTDHHPRRSVAYKFQPQLAATQITSVDFQVGRTGIITPVANFQPVQLSGATLKRVSLHNFDFIKDKDIHLYDWIRLQRSGEVIPYIVSVITDRRTGKEIKIRPPKTCPSCKEPVIQKDMHYYCENPHCPEKTKQQIQHFVSKNCMDINGIGESIVDLLVENKIIENVADIYKLTDHTIQIQLRKFPGFGDKKVAEIAKGVEESKHKALRRLLNGLGIPHVGKKMAQDLASQMNNEQGIMNNLTNAEWLGSIYGIGEKTVENITKFFHDKHNLKILGQLEKAGVNMDPMKYTDHLKASEAKGSFSITGIFPISREKIAEYFQQNGYLFHESPTQTTDFMLIGEKAGNKKIKAQELGIKIYEGRETIIKQFPFLRNIISEGSKPKTQSLF